MSRGPSEAWVFLRFQLRPSWMLRRKSLIDSSWQAVETGYCDILHTSVSPDLSSFRSFPSNDTHAEPLLLAGTFTFTNTWSGNISGRKDRECGQIGVNKIPGTCKYIEPFVFHLSSQNQQCYCCCGDEDHYLWMDH